MNKEKKIEILKKHMYKFNLNINEVFVDLLRDENSINIIIDELANENFSSLSSKDLSITQAIELYKIANFIKLVEKYNLGDLDVDILL